MSSVVISGDTSGAVTLAVPAVAGTNTITVPAATGTMLTTASSGQIIPKAALPTGSVLQVVNATTSTEISTTSTSFISTGFSATITPTSATSKILIFGDFGDVGTLSSAGSQNGVSIYLARNGSQIGANLASQWCYSNTGSSYLINSGNISYIDSPASTSALTYLFYYRVKGANVTGSLFRDGTQGTLTLMEISA